MKSDPNSERQQIILGPEMPFLSGIRPEKNREVVVQQKSLIKWKHCIPQHMAGRNPNVST